MVRLRTWVWLLAGSAACVAAGAPRDDAGVAHAEPHGHPPMPAVYALPSAQPPPAQVYIEGELRAPITIAFPPLLGQEDVSNAVLEVAVHDFQQSELLRVIDPEQYTSVNLGAEGLNVDPKAWRGVGAEAVIKGQATLRGGMIHLELRLYAFSPHAAPTTATLPSFRREYDVTAVDLRKVVHEVDNEVLHALTNVRGSFGTRLAFATTIGQGRKALFLVDSDGTGLSRVPAVSPDVAIAPAFGPGGTLFYAAESAPGPGGHWSIFRLGQQDPLPLALGQTLAVAFSPDNTKMAVVVGHDGASDIYVGHADGTAMALVASGGVNTHPAFGPAGELAYVSTHQGNPQIYVDGRRVTKRGAFNMAPSWCADPEGLKIAFMGRDGTTWDIFTVEPSGNPASVRRLTQDRGSNTYPACSPDGRTIAFFSTRGGLHTMSSRGAKVTPLASVEGESLRWEGN